MTGIGGKNEKQSEFSKAHTFKVNIRITESQYAKIRFGLRAYQMEDKWVAYFSDSRINFHRSWSDAKIYEAEIQKRDDYYTITELFVERDTEIYSNNDDNKDIDTFNYLVGSSLLGLKVNTPINTNSLEDILRGWSTYGNMIME